MDVAMAPFRGAAGAIGGVWELADWATGDELLADFENPFGESETVAGSVVEGLTQFATGFVPIFGALGRVGALSKAGKLAGTARSLVAGASTDFLAFDAHEERLSDLIQKVPALQNPVTEYLASDEDDSVIEGKLKNVLEGLGAGAVVDTSLKALKALKHARVLRSIDDDVGEEAAKKFIGVDLTEKDLAPMFKKPDFNKVAPLEDSVKNFATTGELNTLHVNGEAELADFVYKTVDEVKAKGVSDGLIGNEPWFRSAKKRHHPGKTLDENVQEFMEEAIGVSNDELLKTFKGDIQALDRARVAGRVANAMLSTHADNIQAFARELQGGGDAKSLAKFAKMYEQYHDLIVINRNFSRGFGQGLASQKAYFDIRELGSNESAKEIVERLGGDKHLQDIIAKVSMTTDSVQLAKLVRKSETKTGKILRIHNEWFVQSILSGPKTHVVNMLSNTINTFFLPMERALGAAVRGDFTTATSSALQYTYMADSFVDGMRSALRAWKSGDNILLRDTRPNDLQKSSMGRAGVDTGPANPIKNFFMGLGKFKPTNLLMSSDEFFKTINYRSSAKVKLLNDARKHNQQVDAMLAKGETDVPAKIENLGEYVKENLDKLILKSGEARSESAIVRQAIRDHKDKTGFAQSKAITDQINTMMGAVSKESGLADEIGGEAYLNNVSEFAAGIAKEATFTQEITSEIGKDTQRFLRKHPITQIFVPFFRTPANILKFVGQRTFPVVAIDGIELPILSKLQRRAMEDLKSGDPLKRASLEGRMMSGFGLFGFAAYMVDNGKITGSGPSDPAEKRLLEQTGWQPNAFKLDDGTYLSYARNDPFGIFLGVVADWYELAQRNEHHLDEPLTTIMASAATSLAQNIGNRSYLEGISRLMDAIQEPEMGIFKFAQSHLGSLVPNILGSGVGPMLDEEDGLVEVRGLMDRMKARLPGAGSDLEPVRNLLGEPVRNYRNQGANWINPMAVTERKDDKVMEELAKLQHGFTMPPAEKGNLNLVADYARHPETGQSAYDRWAELTGEVRLGGRTMRQALGRLFKSSEYRRIQDVSGQPGVTDPRVSMVNSLKTKYRKEAWNRMLVEYPEVAKKDRLNRVNKSRARNGLALLSEL